MSNSICLQSFEEGMAQRTNRPLHQGRYKLEECLQNLRHTRHTLHLVRGFVNGKSTCKWLGACMAFEKHMWLKRVPEEMAFAIGYNLLPGLLALRKEGAQCVDSAYPQVERECLALISHMESVRLTIRKDISIEYKHMKRGGSLLEPVVDEAVLITQKALAVT